MSSRNNEAPLPLLIIAIGNPYRGDDAAGLAVAPLLRKTLPAGIQLVVATGEGTALLDAWQDADAVILVDAVHSGSPPGTLHRLDLLAQKIPRLYFRYSTHAFSIPEAVELARVLNRLPPRLILHGIEGEKFAAGEGLSPSVEKALGALVQNILEDVRAIMAASSD